MSRVVLFRPCFSVLSVVCFVEKVPMSELSFSDVTTGDDQTETARAIMREKAPELLRFMAQV